ncbi:DUF695 domain-containing protein [Piscinibacter sp. HJYY11]|uniref:DUF695 domain-containing protein n=1 Tax=Piscinibacter sp. HJYY11 TaxID=2801333 RepID=UPI00191F9624|nr:DUF695 domain-containing protein [Piscinibacter sp. HJYY11]MBL0731204.1 DUF695 domain-containing protein [Piscinibacter sp. HJYY11]MBL0731205.1 DUF695 domain-containing protein [Piscinibacter sp. HJYY11]
MLRKILSVMLFAAFPAAASAQTWAIATSKHSSEDKAIVFRYLDEPPPKQNRETFPVRVVVVWRYQGNKGMPVTPERERMERFEDLLEPTVEKSGLAALVLVSTGNGSREWTYYTKSEEQFFTALNRALAGEKKFPVEIHVGADPTWSTYERFRKQVRK